MDNELTNIDIEVIINSYVTKQHTLLELSEIFGVELSIIEEIVETSV